MQILSHAEFLFGLFSLVGAGVLVIVAIGKSPRLLHEEMADRVKQSIAVLDTCAQPLGGPMAESSIQSLISGNGALSSRR